MKFKSMADVMKFMKQQNVFMKKRFRASAFGSIVGEWIIYSESDGFSVHRFKKYKM